MNVRAIIIAISVSLLALPFTLPTASATGTVPVKPLGTCGTRGCGGEVYNNSRLYVRIANNWCWGDGGDREGDTLPFVTYHNNSGEWPADMWLAPGQYSGSYPKY
jgi:hypothetical protein